MIERINFVGALRRGWRLLVAMAILFAVVAVLLPMPTSKAHKPQVIKFPWRAPAYLASIPPNGIGPAGVSIQTILFWADNYYTKLTAIQAAGLGASAADLTGTMKGTAVGLGAVIGTPKGSTTATTAASTGKSTGSNYVRLLAGGVTRDLALKLAEAYSAATLNAVNKAFAESRRQLSPAAQQASPNATSGLVVAAPTSANRAKKLTVKVKHPAKQLGRKEVGLIGMAAGLLVAALIILARELLNKSLQTAAGAEASFLYPVVVEVPERPGKGAGTPSGFLAVMDEPTSPAAEAYRMLRVSVLFEGLAEAAPLPDPYDLLGDASPSSRLALPGPYETPAPGTRQVVLVVSAGKEDSRPALAANLAAVYAEAGERVIVISTSDIEPGYPTGPVVDRPKEFEPSQLAPHLEQSNLQNVSRLSLRPFVASSGELATRAPVILNAVRELADVVIVESPPLLAVHHGEALVRAVDVVIVVAECRSTTINQAQRAGEVLRRMGAPVLGVALTEVRLSSRDIRQAVWLPEPESDTMPELTDANQPIQEATRS